MPARLPLPLPLLLHRLLQASPQPLRSDRTAAAVAAAAVREVGVTSVATEAALKYLTILIPCP